MSKQANFVTPPIAQGVKLRTSPRPATNPTVRNAKSDADEYGVGIVNSRKEGEQLLLRDRNGEITIITIVGSFDGGGVKIGIRSNEGVDVVRREVAPLDWIEEAACTGRNPERRKSRNE